MVSMDLMNPAYGLYGFSHFWPAWVHLIVVALMVVSGGLVLKALVAHAAGRSRVYGLGCGFVAGLGNLCLSVLAHAEARHTWQLGTVIAIYAVAVVFLIMALVSLWSAESGGFVWARAFHTFLLIGVVASHDKSGKERKKEDDSDDRHRDPIQHASRDFHGPRRDHADQKECVERTRPHEAA